MMSSQSAAQIVRFHSVIRYALRIAVALVFFFVKCAAILLSCLVGLIVPRTDKRDDVIDEGFSQGDVYDPTRKDYNPFLDDQIKY